MGYGALAKATDYLSAALSAYLYLSILFPGLLPVDVLDQLGTARYVAIAAAIAIPALLFLLISFWLAPGESAKRRGAIVKDAASDGLVAGALSIPILLVLLYLATSLDSPISPDFPFMVFIATYYLVAPMRRRMGK